MDQNSSEGDTDALFRISRRAVEKVDSIVDRKGVKAKGAWQVVAGVVPEEPMPSFTKKWLYTVEDYEKDSSHNKDMPYHTIWSKLRAEAMDYYAQVSNPALMNWAEMTFIWY